MTLSRASYFNDGHGDGFSSFILLLQRHNESGIHRKAFNHVCVSFGLTVDVKLNVIYWSVYQGLRQF